VSSRPAYAALIAVCFFWGTTYLGIRMALESFPPLLLVAVRFTASGTIMLMAARVMGAQLPRGRELWQTARNGVLVLGIGNACLTFSELWIPSGLAALFITVSPFWMVGVEALLPGGERLHGPTIAGMLVGLAGSALLIAPGALEAGFGSAILKGFLILQLGSLAWAMGSILQKRQKSSVHPVVSGALQQLAAGLAFALPALIVPDHPVQPSVRGVCALAYLVVFGSIVGYSAFIYAMDKLPVAIVSIYSYVNPIVAVALGWLFYREPFGRTEALAMAIVFAGVWIVKRTAASGKARALAETGVEKLT
jgi:drug/metabolite transporter (DMT)-like permease